jgi:hypothetical protein
VCYYALNILHNSSLVFTFITIFNIPRRKYVHLFAASSHTGVPVFHEKPVPLCMSLLIPVSLLGSFVGRCNTVYITTTGRFFLCLTNNSRSYTLVSFIRLSIGYFHYAVFVQPPLSTDNFSRSGVGGNVCRASGETSDRRLSVKKETPKISYLTIQ